MRTVALTTTALAGLALVFTLGACSEPAAPALPDDSIAIQASVTGACDLVGSFASQFESWLGPRDRIGLLLQTLSVACGAADQTTVEATAWQLLQVSEEFIDGGSAGDPSLGSLIVNELLACTSSLCSSAAMPGIDFTPALGVGGLFAVRDNDMLPAIARDVIPFTDFSGDARTALWGIEVTAPWSVITATNHVLVYGGPVLGNGLTLQELSIGDLQYKLDVFPDMGEFVGDDLHVSACFDGLVDLPSGSVGLEPRMRREGVVLEDYQPGFCPPLPAPQSASVLSPLVSLARRILPAAITRRLFLPKITVVGGTPLDFSRFAPVASLSNGHLEFVSGPDAVVTENQSIGNMKVLAVSGDGTPMEKVLINLYLVTNNGVPAGGILSGDLTSYTQEHNGMWGIASFPDDGPIVTVGKPGGYRVCATGVLAGFTFPDVCSDRFHARNGK
jgi:hypothetical protein